MTEQELKNAFTELPERFWGALTYEIGQHIEDLEKEANPQIALNHGAVSHVMGGIYYLRNLLYQLDNYRELKNRRGEPSLKQR